MRNLLFRKTCATVQHQRPSWIPTCITNRTTAIVAACILLLVVTINIFVPVYTGASKNDFKTYTAAAKPTITTPLMVHSSHPIAVAPTKVLFGIFSVLDDGEPYRNKFRALFLLHPKVCTLGNYQRNHHSEAAACEYIYAFVLGFNISGPTELVNASRPILVQDPVHVKDTNKSDMVLLNIAENMNEGKSQTWLYYTSTIASDLGVDYIGKTDTDAVPFLDRYFQFARTELPPVPYNQNHVAAMFNNKRQWFVNYQNITATQTLTDQQLRAEEPYRNKYIGGGLHLYPMGQMYMLSVDLVAKIVDVAQTTNDRRFLSDVEDHAIGCMALLAAGDRALTFIAISATDRWWTHGIKMSASGNGMNSKLVLKRWVDFWSNETARLQRIMSNSTE